MGNRYPGAPFIKIESDGTSRFDVFAFAKSPEGRRQLEGIAKLKEEKIIKLKQEKTMNEKITTVSTRYAKYIVELAEKYGDVEIPLFAFIAPAAEVPEEVIEEAKKLIQEMEQNHE